jgi:hypothetical protein
MAFPAVVNDGLDVDSCDPFSRSYRFDAREQPLRDIRLPAIQALLPFGFLRETKLMILSLVLK